YAYFLNGGGVAYVVRIGADEENGKQPELPTARAELPPANAGDKVPFTVESKEGGVDGDRITVEVADASEQNDDTFKLIVRAPGRDEVFDNVTLSKGPNNVATKVRA